MEDISGFDAQGTIEVEQDDTSVVAMPRLSGLTFPLEAFGELELDTRPQWLVTGLMPSSGLHVLYGAPGAGKSFVGLHAALHVAAGRRWAGRPVRQGPVIYIAAEGKHGFRRRILAAKQALKLSDDVPFKLITRPPNLGGKKHDTATLIRDIRRQCGEEYPRLIVLDTLSRSIRDLRESDAQDIMEFVENAETLSAAFADALVMPIHHCGKDESKGMRGSSALHGAADAEWLVARDPKTGARLVSVEKMKDGPDRATIKFELKDHHLGTDQAGDPIVTCVASVFDVEVDVPVKETSGDRNLTQTQSMLAAIKMLVAIEGRPAVEPASAAAGTMTVSLKRLKEVASASAVMQTKPENTGTAIRRALEALKAEGMISMADDVVRLLGARTAPLAEPLAA